MKKLPWYVSATMWFILSLVALFGFASAIQIWVINPIVSSPKMQEHIKQIRPQIMAANIGDIIFRENGSVSMVREKIPGKILLVRIQGKGNLLEELSPKYDIQCSSVEQVVHFNPYPESEWTRGMKKIREAFADLPAQ